MRSSGNWRVLVDCSTFLSGIFYFQGKSNIILEMWVLRRYDLYITQEIYIEYQNKLKEVADRMGKNAEAGKYWFQLIDKRAIFIKPILIPEDSCRDPNDLKYLEAARGSEADFLVSSDKDLLILKKFDQTKILSPSAFLEIFVKKQR